MGHGGATVRAVGGKEMIAFEVENNCGGITRPIVICDHCVARIVGDGNALWIMPPGPGPNGLSIGDRYLFESPIFHVHKRCNRAFEAAYRERHGDTDFMWEDLWEHLTQALNNAVVRDDKQARRIFAAVEKVVEAEAQRRAKQRGKS